MHLLNINSTGFVKVYLYIYVCVCVCVKDKHTQGRPMKGKPKKGNIIKVILSELVKIQCIYMVIRLFTNIPKCV